MNAGKTGSRAKRAGGTDWRGIRSRLEAAREAAERGWQPGPEETKEILKARARALAREVEAPQEATEAIEVIEFVVARERYAVESAYVREIYPLNDLTPLPCTPRFVLGIVNVRGQILSVIDIKKFFDLPEKGLSDLNKVVILRSEAMEFGVLADSIAGTRVLPVHELQPSLPTLTGIREEYLRGVTADRTAILDAGKLLSDPKIVVHEQVAA